MLKKTIKYVDYNSVEHTDDFYFNLSKAEIAEMELSVKGGFSASIQKAVDEKDNAKILEIFKDLLLRSYGVKSEDGKRFIKSKEMRDEFEQSEAYSNLFIDLVTNEEASSEFLKAIIPSSLAESINKQVTESNKKD